MLPRKNRLTKRSDFALVYRRGAFFSEGPLSLKAAKNTLGYPRIGFSIEKKFFRKAVERNRIKRLLREAFHHHVHAIPTGVDIVVFYKKIEKDPTLKTIDTLVEKIIKKIK